MKRSYLFLIMVFIAVGVSTIAYAFDIQDQLQLYMPFNQSILDYGNYDRYVSYSQNYTLYDGIFETAYVGEYFLDVTNIYDHNYSTFGQYNLGGNCGQVYFRRELDSGTINATWQVKDGDGFVNLTLPEDCFNWMKDQPEYYNLRVQSCYFPSSNDWACQYEEEQWHSLRSGTSEKIYDEDIFVLVGNFTDDKNGNPYNAFRFNNDSWITVNGSVDLSGTNFTVSFWTYLAYINPVSGSANQQQMYHHGNNDIAIYQIDTESNILGTYHNSSSFQGLREIGTQLDQWYYITYIKDIENTYIYVDGELANTTTTVGDVFYNNQNITISGDLNNDKLFNGSLDDIRVYNKTLSDWEIRNIYNAFDNNNLNITSNLANYGANIDVKYFNISINYSGLSGTTICGAYDNSSYLSCSNASASSSAAVVQCTSTATTTQLINVQPYCNNAGDDYISDSINLYSVLNMSAMFTVRDESTGEIIENVSGEYFLGDIANTFNTTNGTISISELNTGEYSFSFIADGYSSRSYIIDITGTTATQEYNIYLTSSTNTVVLTYQNEVTTQEINDVIVTMSRAINETWQVVESRTTDITGRVQFVFAENGRYKFDSSAAGYVDKSFTLNPIIFTAYTVKLTPSSVVEDSLQDLGIYVNYAPKAYQANTTGNFIFIISSPGEYLIDYSVSFIYGANITTSSGVSSIGETLQIPYNLSDPNQRYVVINYSYTSAAIGAKSFSARYLINNITSNNTLYNPEDPTYGLGIFDRVIIVVSTVIIMGGIITGIAGVAAGGSVALLVLGIFAFINFISWYAVYGSLIIGVLVLLMGGKK